MTTHSENRMDSHRQGVNGARPHRDSAAKPGARAQAALGWAALVVLLAGVLKNGAFDPLPSTLLCLAILVLFAVQVVFDIRYGLPGQARKALWLVVAFIVVLVWLCIQGTPGLPAALAHPFWDFAPEGALPAISAEPDGSSRVVMRLVCYGLTFWIFLRSAVVAPKGGLFYIIALAVFSAALSVYGMVSLKAGSNVLLGSEGPDSVLRASFVNRNAYVTFAVFGVLASMTAFVDSMSRSFGSRRAMRSLLEGFFDGGWLYAMCALVGLAAATMTLSRGGALAGLLGVSVLIWALRRARRSIPRVVFAVPTALVGFVVLFMSTGTFERFDTFDATGDARALVYGQILEGIRDRPLLGHGAGGFKVAFRPYVPAEWAAFEWDFAHSTYLENAFEFGLPAATVFYLVLGVVGWRLFLGVRTRRRNQVIPAFALSCYAAGMGHSAVDFSLQYPALAALFAAILGLGWGQSFAKQRQAGDRS